MKAEARIKWRNPKKEECFPESREEVDTGSVW